MASLSTNDKQVLEKLFQMGGGYVLNFTNRTMGEFFADDVGINIYDKKYNYASGSKANYIRGFWQIADNDLVGKSIRKLIEYVENQVLIGELSEKDFSKPLIERGKKIADDLCGIKTQVEEIKEDEFINREFKNITVDRLGLDGIVSDILRQRIDEIRKCLTAKASLSVIFLCGSTLEGILLGVATLRPKEFNQAAGSPKDKTGKVKQFYDWTLNDFINVARELNLLGEDVKKFSHALRDFRNYIHPYEQMSSKFHPDEHTAKICWQVLQAATVQLSNNMTIR